MRCKFSVLGGKWLTQNSEEKLKVLWEVTVVRIVKVIADLVHVIIVFLVLLSILLTLSAVFI
jgi:hypothetical protein